MLNGPAWKNYYRSDATKYKKNRRKLFTDSLVLIFKGNKPTVPPSLFKSKITSRCAQNDGDYYFRDKRQLNDVVKKGFNYTYFYFRPLEFKNGKQYVEVVVDLTNENHF